MRTDECGSRILEWIASSAERDDAAQSRRLSLGLDAGLDNRPQPSVHLNAGRGAQAVSKGGRNCTEGELMAGLFGPGARRAADAVRNGEQTAEALAEALLARCAASPLYAVITLEADRLRAADRESTRL